MGVPRYERPDGRDDDVDIISYTEAIELVRRNARRKTYGTVRTHVPRDYVIPHPKKDEPYATVQLDYLGDFGDDKDPAEYALRMVGFE